MSILSQLQSRAESKCELCSATEDLSVFEVPHSPEKGPDFSILICSTCLSAIEGAENADSSHWRCLNDSMWSPVPAVQVMAWRILNSIRAEGWPVDLLDMMYMDDETKAWAEAIENAVVHKDAHGAVLKAGDTVTLTQSLNVKGSSLTAKRGTAVRNISLVHDNPEQIEGRVEGQKIVILTKYVKRSNP